MRIELVNFRCYKKASFDLADSGMVLLSGSSGKGKTSILLAIQFALYGIGSKLIHYEANTCKVTLVHKDLHVERTKRPNRLLVNKVYENEAGQSIINNVFGTSFITTSCVQQNISNSFILLSPLEKLAFLESFLANGDELLSLKKTCKEEAKKRHEEHIQISSQLEMAKSVLDSTDCPEKIPFPIKCKVSQRDIAERNEIVQYKNCELIIQKAMQQKDTLIQQKNQLQLSLYKQESLEQQIKNIEKQINAISNIQFESLPPKEMILSIIAHKHHEEKLTTIQSTLQEKKGLLYNLTNEKEQERKNTLSKAQTIIDTHPDKDIIISYKDYSEKALDVARYWNTLRKLGNKIKNEILQECRPENVIQQELDNITNEIQKWELYIDAKKCPVCNNNLRFNEEGVLETFDPLDEGTDYRIRLQNAKETSVDLKKELETSRKNESNIKSYTRVTDGKNKEWDKVETIWKNIPWGKNEELTLLSSGFLQGKEENVSILQWWKQQIKTWDNALSEVQQAEKMIHSTSSDSNIVTKLREEIQLLEREYCKVSDVTIDTKSFDQEYMEMDVLSLNALLAKIEQTECSIQQTLSERNRLHEEHECLVSEKEKEKQITLKLGTEDDIQCSIKKYTHILEMKEKEKKQHSQRISEIEEWKRNNEKRNVYKTWNTKYKTLQKEENRTRRIHTNTVRVLDKIVESENLALTHLIQVINMHAQVYIEAFFPEHPMTVLLDTFRETKNQKQTKPSIHIKIMQGACECDISSLSGGELARVILAFTLALAEIVNTPLILLDECTANLDQELTTSVFDIIQEHFQEQLVIFVAHQVITGSFDHVVSL